MPQVFQVLQCSSCKTFQVDIVKKIAKWSCKLCTQKQSVIKVYSRGNGKECRLHVQELNEKRIKTESEIPCEILTNVYCDLHLLEETRGSITCIDKTDHKSLSDLEAEDAINSIDIHNSKCKIMCRGTKRYINREEYSTSATNISNGSKWDEFILTDDSKDTRKNINHNNTVSEVLDDQDDTIEKHIRNGSKWVQFSKPVEEYRSTGSKQNVINYSVPKESNKKTKLDKPPELDNYKNGSKYIKLYSNNLFQSADIDVDEFLQL